MHARSRFAITMLAVAVATASAAANDSYKGKRFPTFKAKDAISGEPLALESLRGKVVLIDFWATWCGPCVGELPNVKKTYQKYKDQGFEIVSVSLDSDQNKFKRFVRAQKMSWYHVMEGGGWKTRLAKKYRINSIPAMYLLDHEGVCISDRARGSSLERAVRDAVAKIPNRAGGTKGNGRARDVATGPNPRVKTPAGVDVSDSVRVLVEIAQARETIEEATAPIRTIGQRLASVEKSIASIDRQMPSPRSPSSVRRRFAAMCDELAAIRSEMYVCGLLNKEIPALPVNPFADYDVDEDRGLTLAWGELPNARKAVKEMGLYVNVVSRQVKSVVSKLDRLERRLSRDARSVKQAERAEVLVSANRLATRCRDAWETQFKVVDRALATHTTPEGEKLRSEFAALKATLDDENVDVTAARKRFTTICGKLLALGG